jgi:hypothetical protein
MKKLKPYNMKDIPFEELEGRTVRAVEGGLKQ